MRLLLVLLLCCLVTLPCLAYERMAAWQDSLVEMADGFPYAALVTYDNSRPDQPMWLQQVTLGKLLVGLKVGERVEWWKEAEVTVLPEGLVATGSLAGAKLTLCAAAADDRLARPRLAGGSALRAYSHWGARRGEAAAGLGRHQRGRCAADRWTLQGDPG